MKKQPTAEQKTRCDKCDWKELEHHGGWCYMFKEFMPGCMQFKPSVAQRVKSAKAENSRQVG